MGLQEAKSIPYLLGVFPPCGERYFHASLNTLSCSQEPKQLHLEIACLHNLHAQVCNNALTGKVDAGKPHATVATHASLQRGGYARVPLSVAHPGIAAQWAESQTPVPDEVDLCHYIEPPTMPNTTLTWRCTEGHEWQSTVKERVRSRDAEPLKRAYRQFFTIHLEIGDARF